MHSHLYLTFLTDVNILTVIFCDVRTEILGHHNLEQKLIFERLKTNYKISCVISNCSAVTDPIEHILLILFLDFASKM